MNQYLQKIIELQTNIIIHEKTKEGLDIEILQFKNDIIEVLRDNIKGYKPDVHTEHCCLHCGCKYGDGSLCTVLNMSKPQSKSCNGDCSFHF